MELLLIFLIGFFSSLLGSFVSGTTSALSLTSLLAFGLPAYSALAIHRFGLFGFDLGGIREYTRANKIEWELIPILSILGIVAAYLGSRIILSVDQEVISKLVGMSVLIFIPLMIFKPSLGVIKTQVSKTKKRLGYAAYFMSTLWGSSFNIGVGIFFIYIHTFFFGQTILESKATNKIPGLIKNIIVISVFFSAGLLDFKLGLTYLAGMFMGSTIATHLMLKVGDKWLRNILFITVGILAAKLILDL